MNRIETTERQCSDDDLLRLAVSGDEEAFLALYRRRHTALFRFAQHTSGSTSLAEEVVQEVFMSLLRDGCSNYKPGEGTLAAYLFGMTRNLVRKHLERGRRHVELAEETLESLPVNDDGVLAGLARSETIEAVRRAVHDLPEPFREAVVLCDLQELPYQETAELLQIPVGTVRSRLNRGRALLAQRLSLSEMRCAT
jgi:RNA polymerase sigma-70 factor, ECF subfamily